MDGYVLSEQRLLLLSASTLLSWTPTTGQWSIQCLEGCISTRVGKVLLVDLFHSDGQGQFHQGLRQGSPSWNDQEEHTVWLEGHWELANLAFQRLRHPEIQQDRPNGSPRATPEPRPCLDSDDIPQTSRQIRDLGLNKTPKTRKWYNVIAKGFEA
ncbi:hypothetical protein V3481_015348 [Fusarium oxysporum f. sp. vasinfectum]